MKEVDRAKRCSVDKIDSTRLLLDLGPDGRVGQEPQSQIWGARAAG